jgi:hypothetical protein
MYERVERPMTAPERCQIEKQLRRLDKRTSNWTPGCAGALFGGLGLISLVIAAATGQWKAALIVIPGAAAAYALIVLWTKFELASSKKKAKGELQALLDRNVAVEERVEATAMVVFEEVEDLGNYYAYQVEPDQVLILSISQQYAWDRRVRCNAFSIVSIGHRYGYVAKRGRSLEPIRVMSEEEQVALGLVCPPIGLFAGRLEEIEKILAPR